MGVFAEIPFYEEVFYSNPKVPTIPESGGVRPGLVRLKWVDTL